MPLVCFKILQFLQGTFLIQRNLLDSPFYARFIARKILEIQKCCWHFVSLSREKFTCALSPSVGGEVLPFHVALILHAPEGRGHQPTPLPPQPTPSTATCSREESIAADSLPPSPHPQMWAEQHTSWWLALKLSAVKSPASVHVPGTCGWDTQPSQCWNSCGGAGLAAYHSQESITMLEFKGNSTSVLPEAPPLIFFIEAHWHQAARSPLSSLAPQPGLLYF